MYGMIEGSNATGGIVGYPRSTGAEVKNCYFLENTISGVNDYEIKAGVTSKTSEELKNLTSILGDAYKEDYENNINNGYPILVWQ